MSQQPQPAPGLTLTGGAAAAPGAIVSVRIVGSRIAAVNRPPETGDRVIDLRGDRLLPGLINAHDHLQLNTLPALETSRTYRHAREWIAEIDARRHTDSAFQAQAAIAREQRLLIGGIKNLLSGVTTVAHHDPAYPYLWSEGFPVRVVDQCGWSHSLYLDGEDEVRQSHQRTPPDWPWIIHAGEGVDKEATTEFSILDSLGCITANTLVVHGIALTEAHRGRLRQLGAGLIWCPGSNLRLFGRTAEVAELAQAGRVAVGTDSRLSGSRDLLTELRLAREVSRFDEATLERLVTRDSAALLRLPERGVLRAGARADMVILPAGLPLSHARRADIRVVMLGGIARYGDADYAGAMAPTGHWADVIVDGSRKLLERRLAVALLAAQAVEPGLDVVDSTWRAA